jgi:hypothetical protein
MSGTGPVEIVLRKCDLPCIDLPSRHQYSVRDRVAGLISSVVYGRPKEVPMYVNPTPVFIDTAECLLCGATNTRVESGWCNV